jgi:hypothetical protein
MLSGMMLGKNVRLLGKWLGIFVRKSKGAFPLCTKRKKPVKPAKNQLSCNYSLSDFLPHRTGRSSGAKKRKDFYAITSSRTGSDFHLSPK